MPNSFHYDDAMRVNFPELSTRTLYVAPIHSQADVSEVIARFHDVARERLAIVSEGELPEIQAWRRAFNKMGLKPTQYRCAAEALLRRFRMEGNLPRLHPLIDLCNAVSMAYAIPIAVFDSAKIDQGLEVRPATGEEIYETFSGEVENPAPGEIIFADETGRAHARRWTNRQSGYSAVGDGTAAAFIVVEALHPTAAEDIGALVSELKAALIEMWPACRVVA